MIIKKTAFCSNKTCCPTIVVDTESLTVTITDDYDNTLVMPTDEFLGADAVVHDDDTGLNPKYRVTATKEENEYTIMLEYGDQKVKGITLEQWDILAETVRDAGLAALVEETELMGLYV